ncbi:hypothetical protein [Ahrensia kielensis]|nr:hypothetical protein [Ahrensia kielensis]
MFVLELISGAGGFVIGAVVRVSLLGGCVCFGFWSFAVVADGLGV